MIYTGKPLLLMTGLLIAVTSTTYALEMAKIQLSLSQDVTSSTLKWVDRREGEKPPEHALRVTRDSDNDSLDGPVWCRAHIRGTWASGAVENGKCHIPFLKQVHEIPQYEVLVSINGSARVVLQEWDRHQAIPDHGITTPDMLLAIGVSEEGDVYPGYVSTRERRAYILKDGKTHRQENALILTELEPIQYILDHVVREEEKSVTTSTEEEIANTTLTNLEKTDQLVTDMLDYEAKEVVYWGRIRGTITGLPSTVIDPSGKEWEITWGIENELDKLEQQLVEFGLPAEASVDVSLVAVIQKYEASYSGQLTSIYKDGFKRQHPISGPHSHKRLAELRADFSQPYFTHNKTDIQGEYMPSQILRHSTTTTTTTTTTPSSSSAGPDGNTPHSESVDVEDSTNTRPVAEQMSGASAAGASFWMCFSSIVWMLSIRIFTFTH